VRSYLERQYTDPRTQREIAGQSVAYKRLGLVPETLDLKALYLELLEEQVVGYYDPKTKALYVVQGSNPDLAPAIIRHELVHALQDQYLNLDSLLQVEGQNDRQTAVQAAIEGQAIWVQLAHNNPAAGMPEGWARIREEIRSNLVQRNAVDRIYADLPASTEQVMHENAYFGVAGDAAGDSAGRRDDPTVVTLPRPLAGTVEYQNTVGEFETRLLIYGHLDDQPLAVRAANGWDGDRYMVVRSGAGDALVWVSVWDSAVDAGEFFDAVGQGVSRRYPGVNATPSENARTYLVPSTAQRGARTVTVRVSEIGGRPVVVYSDVPAGLPSDLIELRAITLR
jgi:hypothetical protein